MFLAGIIKTHTDTEQELKQPAADESATTLDAEAVADAVADATWPSFKPRVAPSYFGRTTGGRTIGSAEPSRARWT